MLPAAEGAAAKVRALEEEEEEEEEGPPVELPPDLFIVLVF